MLVYFKYNGNTVFGKIVNSEVVLPSGYTMPVENGHVFYLGAYRQLYDVNHRPL